MQIDQSETANANLIAQAYLAPQSTKTFYRPRNAQFWTAIVVLMLGNAMILSGIWLMFRLPWLQIGLQFIFGFFFTWKLAAWIDPRIVPKISPWGKERIVGALGIIPLSIVMIVIIFLNPGTDYRNWIAPPFVLPASWSMLCGIFFQLSAATKQSLIESSPVAQDRPLSKN